MTNSIILYMHWQNCPEPVRNLLNGILAYYRQLLGEYLIGFYLHGSLAMGCFNPLLSDIDFLAVVRRKLTVSEKKAIIDYLLGTSDDSSPVGPEMSIVTEDSVNNLVFPSPFELHYSNSWRERYLSGDVDWNRQQNDKDLVMHYLAVRRRGICLYGKPIGELFPEIPRDMLIKSLLQDFNWLSQRIEELPITYGVLNLCRIIAFLREGTLMSKQEGGEWALVNLPTDFSAIISQSLAIYAGDEMGDIHDDNARRSFIDFATKEIARITS